MVLLFLLLPNEINCACGAYLMVFFAASAERVQDCAGFCMAFLGDTMTDLFILVLFCCSLCVRHCEGQKKIDFFVPFPEKDGGEEIDN